MIARIRRRAGRGSTEAVTHIGVRDPDRLNRSTRSARARRTVDRLAPHSDHGDPNRPKVGEVGLGKAVRDVLLKGGGTPAERAHVAVGLIEAKVRKAYRMEAA